MITKGKSKLAPSRPADLADRPSEAEDSRER